LEALEEAGFTRKNVTKADKRKRQKKMERQFDVLADVGNYGDMTVFEEDMGEKKKNEEYLMRKRMQQQLDLFDTRKNPKKRSTPGDEDVPEKLAKKRTQVQGRGFVFDDGEVQSDDEDAEPQKRPRFEAGYVPLPEKELEEGSKRKASKSIEQNRGLRRIRNKKTKTPYTRYKNAFNKKMAKVGHKMREPTMQNYSGEGKKTITNTSRSKTYAG